MKLIVLAVWFILVRPLTGPQAPYTLGPYESAEACRVGARQEMPEAVRFMTPADIALKNELERRKAADAVAFAKVLAQTPHDKDGWARVGYTRVHFNAKGEQDAEEIIVSSISSSHGLMHPVNMKPALVNKLVFEDVSLTPLSGCTEIK